MEYHLDKNGCYCRKKVISAQKLKKLNTFDWLCDIPEAQKLTDWVEVQFKNTRKGYYLNSNKLELEKGDIVAVESSPGHDIGEVTLTGSLVLKQMKKNNFRFDQQEVRRVYRIARPVDLEKYEEAKGMEHGTMLKSRKIAEDLHLNMKIGDVEYQGDGNKAIFYYIADDRVDFRQLIKVLAETFHIRIEMKQIGARQEAGRIGGVGPCGRELCCSSWMTSFNSVSTSSARYQDLSLNPQKLAGQCAKLKCCLNYEIDTYVESSRDIPSKDIVLETKEASFYLFKTDILKRTMTYSTSKDFLANEITLPVERVKNIIQLNKKGIRVESLSEEVEVEKKKEFGDILTEGGLDRFDHSRKANKNKKNKSRHQGELRNKDGNPDTRSEPVQPSKEAASPVSQQPQPPQSSQPSQSQNASKNRQHQPPYKAKGNQPEGTKETHQQKANRPQQNRPRFEKPQKNTPGNDEAKESTK
ncbi:MAG: regulatory iron-sulfur-containing complex subunit RicT [Bacteroidota bacterium]|nr:regulatory iron-sulfur-containing complex subunit RicT [Bacteroidota bacterium]